MESIDDLLAQQFELIKQMDFHYQKRVKSLKDRIGLIMNKMNVQDEPIPLIRKGKANRSAHTFYNMSLYNHGGN